jgi:glycerophosphoryl diester phosphodiesterase
MPANHDYLQNDEVLYPNQSLTSADGRFILIYQGDGNLVLYRQFPGQERSWLWDSETHGRPGGACVMQGDGNLVIYLDGQAIWSSNTWGNPGSRLVVQNDGNVVIYRPDGRAIWATHTVYSEKRPFYVIAHRCNDAERVQAAIHEGANAIECDLQYNGTHNVFVVNHDTDLFYQRDALIPYLQRVRAMAQADSRLALIIFDCKFAKETPAVPLLETIRVHLTDHVPVKVVISIADYDKRSFFMPLKDRLRPNEFLAIDEHEHSGNVARFFAWEMRISQYAYGYGISASEALRPGIPAIMMEAVAQKYADPDRRFSMVYVWTVQNQQSMRRYLNIGVDGIFVDNVRALREVLAEPEFQKLRMALRSDPLTAEPAHAAYVLTVKTSDVGSSGTDADLYFELSGPEGHVGTLLDATPPGLFERGQTHRVTLLGSPIGRPHTVRVNRSTRGNGPDWHLQSIKVESRQLPGSLQATFNTWIPALRWSSRAL